MDKIRNKLTKKSFVAKLAIVSFYLAIVALFLYMPRMYRYFFPQKQVLVIYTPQEVFALEMLEEFEKRTGIQVKVAYFSSQEELLAKFKINRGVGYDLVVPSDYMVEYLIQEGLLQPLDHKKISHAKELDQRILSQFYDPKNKYSLPVAWIPYGIGFNKKFITLDNTVSWDIVFKRKALQALGDYKVSMLNDAREAVFLTSLYLFGSTQDFTGEKLEQIAQTLIKQKKIVECYVEAGAKQLLLSEIVPMAVIPAARMKEMGEFGMGGLDYFGFVIPKEGSLVDIVNLVIPATTAKADLAHQLIDFLLSKEVGAYNFDVVACNPANKKAYDLVDKRYVRLKAFFPDDKLFNRLRVLNNKISPKILENIWFRVKSA